MTGTSGMRLRTGRLFLLMSLVAATDAGFIIVKYLADGGPPGANAIRTAAVTGVVSLLLYLPLGVLGLLAILLTPRRFGKVVDRSIALGACGLAWLILYHKTTRLLPGEEHLSPAVISAGILIPALTFAILRVRRIGRWLAVPGSGLGVAVLLTLLPGGTAAPPGSGSNPGPDVILIIVDTLRFDRVGPRDEGGTLTPNIDRVAENARVYENAHVHWPASAPSHGAILTSLPVYVHATLNGMSLDPRFDTLAEEMKRRGYATAGFVQNPMLSHRNHFDQGFDVYINEGRTDFHGATAPVLCHYLTPLLIAYRFLERDRFTDEAIDWLGRNHDRRKFLFLQYFFPHIPYTPPSRFVADDGYRGPIVGSLAQSRSIRDGTFEAGPGDIERMIHLYDGEVRYADAEIGRLMDFLETAGLRQNTLIVITADHGENLYEHDRFFAHGNELYESTVHVPLIVSVPGEGDGQVKHPELIRETDIMPLILDVTRVDRSGVVTAREPPYLSEEVEILGMTCNGEQVLLYSLFGSWKYILNMRTMEEELYDLSHDDTETHDLHLEKTERCARFRGLVLREADENPPIRRFISQHCGEEVRDPEMREMLKALGYLD